MHPEFQATDQETDDPHLWHLTLPKVPFLPCFSQPSSSISLNYILSVLKHAHHPFQTCIWTNPCYHALEGLIRSSLNAQRGVVVLPCRSYVTLAAGFSFVSLFPKTSHFYSHIVLAMWPIPLCCILFFPLSFFLAHYFSILRCFWCWSPLRPPTVFSCFSSSTCLLLRRNFLQETALDDIPPPSKYFLSQRQWRVIPCVMWEMQTWNNIDWLIYWQQEDTHIQAHL